MDGLHQLARIGVAILAVSLVAWGPSAWADRFFLSHGATLEGKWLNASGHHTGEYQIETEDGGLIVLKAAQVVRVRQSSASEDAYLLRAAATADTAAGHWELAQWCRAEGLDAERKNHLRRIIELDPQHVAARRALGFAQIGGRWVTQREYLEARGYLHYKGQWRLPQEVTLIKEQEAARQAQQHWLRRLRTLARQLVSDQPAESRMAWQALREIRDAETVVPLGRLLREDYHRAVRLAFVEVLGNIPETSATALLLATALRDTDPEVFHACLEHLVARHSPALVRTLVEGLKDGNNDRVNRAAYVLGALQDPTAISPLIDALVTTHARYIPGSPNLNFSFISPGPNLSMGSAQPQSAQGSSMLPLGGFMPSGAQMQSPRAPQVVPVRVANQHVADALVRLSGGTSFGYDQQAWRHWYAARQRQ